VLFLVLQGQQRAAAQEALNRFHAERAAASFDGAVVGIIAKADQALWSSGRIESYRDHAPAAASAALAVLRIPRLSLEAPVFEGALDAELDRGPGWIRGTAPVGGRGNVGIAGHRDGFFRTLKDIAKGDTIEVIGRDSEIRYRVTDTWIVEPDAVHVLDPTPESALTLVTCYPFYYVGHAPQRFIVRAVAQSI
jgi:sortase A